MPRERVYPIDPYPKVVINAAITGAVPTRAHSPHVPIDEDEIVGDAVACHRAGAAIVHLHVRDEQGDPDYRAERYGRVIRRIRERCDVIICVSTSGRRFGGIEERSEVLFLAGCEKPELASLTTGSFNFPTQASVNPPETIIRLAETMLARGIKPEFEVFDTGMLNYAKYVDKKLDFPKPMYFNLLLGALGGIPARIGELAYLIQNLPESSVWSATGIGLFQLPMNMAALVAGGHIRVGLEDNLYLDFEKKILATNPQLVARAAGIAKHLGREAATPNEARRMLNLPGPDPG